MCGDVDEFEYNNKIFQQLDSDQIEIHQKLGVSYIMKLLIPHVKLINSELHYVKNMLSKLLEEEYHAPSFFFPL